MFEQASNMDAGEKEEDRHWVEDLDAMLNHEPEDEEATPPEVAQATRLQQIEDMRRMATMVNEAMGGRD